MAIIQPRRLSFIPQIDPDTHDWTVTVQVVECHRVTVGKGTPNKPGKRYRRYMMADEQGNKVSVIVYESDIRYFEYTLIPYRRFNVSNALVIPAVSFFKVGPYPFSWVLDWKKLVEPIHEAIPPPLPFAYDVLDFTEFSKHADTEFSFDVKGAVIHAFPRKQISEKSSHREIVIVDERKIPIIFTLWNDFGDVEGLQLANQLPFTSTIIARNVKATSFHGLSLSTRMYSCFLINPPLPDRFALTEWSHNNTTDIKKMIKDHTFRDPSILFPPPSMGDTITVGDAIATLPLRKTAWVIGKPKFIPGKQKLFYNACQTCKRRLDCPMEWVIECSECGEKSGVEYWSRLPIELTEADHSLFVTITSPDVERLTMVTPKQIQDSDEFHLNVEEELKEALEKLTIVCFLKNKEKKNKEGQPRAIPKYWAVKTYNVTELRNNDDVQSPPNEITAPAEEEKEKEFFTPTTGKVLAEIEKENLHTKSKELKLSVKRNIDFIAAGVSTGTSKLEPVSSSDPAASAQPSTLDSCSTESPIKKNKEHLKQS